MFDFCKSRLCESSQKDSKTFIFLHNICFEYFLFVKESSLKNGTTNIFVALTYFNMLIMFQLKFLSYTKLTFSQFDVSRDDWNS